MLLYSSKMYHESTKIKILVPRALDPLETVAFSKRTPSRIHAHCLNLARTVGQTSVKLLPGEFVEPYSPLPCPALPCSSALCSTVSWFIKKKVGEWLQLLSSANKSGVSLIWRPMECCQGFMHTVTAKRGGRRAIIWSAQCNCML